MAPKGKAAPAKPAAKPGKPAAKAPKVKKPPLTGDAAIKEKQKKIFILCGIITVFSIVMIVLLVLQILDLHKQRQKVRERFLLLRSTWSEVTKEPRFRENKPKDVAKALMVLPVRVNKLNDNYKDKKKTYLNLFGTKKKSSSGPWKFHGRSLYYFSKEPKTWYNAEKFCISREGHLASVLNKEEQNFISAQLAHTSWIGLRFEDKEGKWKWTDGSTLEKQYWSEGQRPKAKVSWKSDQHCAMILPSLTYHNWKENSCHKLYRWVCKENLENNKDG